MKVSVERIFVADDNRVRVGLCHHGSFETSRSSQLFCLSYRREDKFLIALSYYCQSLLYGEKVVLVCDSRRALGYFRPRQPSLSLDIFLLFLVSRVSNVSCHYRASRTMFRAVIIGHDKISIAEKYSARSLKEKKSHFG